MEAKHLHQQDSDLPCYEAKEFSNAEEAQQIFHGFFGRQGGKSANIYASLNCGYGSEDNPGSVIKNYQTIGEYIGIEPGNILTLHQTHSSQCIKVDEPWLLSERPKADAMVTDVPGLALGILTADCAPVLFRGQTEEGKPVIGAAHAGWEGALNGVLESALKEMEALGAVKTEVYAAIGPCISKASYEVSEEFYKRFVEENEENERFFQSARKEQHFMFDLPGYTAFKLYQAGLSKVYIKDLDTYFNEEDFFSYRRSVHRDERDYGRQISVIMIKS